MGRIGESSIETWNEMKGETSSLAVDMVDELDVEDEGNGNDDDDDDDDGDGDDGEERSRRRDERPATTVRCEGPRLDRGRVFKRKCRFQRHTRRPTNGRARLDAVPAGARLHCLVLARRRPTSVAHWLSVDRYPVGGVGKCEPLEPYFPSVGKMGSSSSLGKQSATLFL